VLTRTPAGLYSAAQAVDAAYGPGVVPLPGRTTFYKVIDAVAAGRHTFGSAVTRPQKTTQRDSYPAASIGLTAGAAPSVAMD